MESLPLKKASRDREYSRYSISLRAKVVHGYLFSGKSHRWLDDNALRLDFDGRGYQSMGILHYLGLVAKHKGWFKDVSKNEAIRFLDSLGGDYSIIAEHLRHSE